MPNTARDKNRLASYELLNELREFFKNSGYKNENIARLRNQ